MLFPFFTYCDLAASELSPLITPWVNVSLVSLNFSAHQAEAGEAFLCAQGGAKVLQQLLQSSLVLLSMAALYDKLS